MSEINSYNAFREQSVDANSAESVALSLRAVIDTISMLMQALKENTLEATALKDDIPIREEGEDEAVFAARVEQWEARVEALHYRAADIRDEITDLSKKENTLRKKLDTAQRKDLNDNREQLRAEIERNAGATRELHDATQSNDDVMSSIADRTKAKKVFPKLLQLLRSEVAEEFGQLLALTLEKVKDSVAHNNITKMSPNPFMGPPVI